MKRQTYGCNIDGHRDAPTFGSRHIRRLSLAAAIAAAALAAGSVGAHAATFTSLHKFTGGADGAAPYGALERNVHGLTEFYGTTAFGGKFGHGTVFSLTHVSGNVWTHKVLYNFKGSPDGANPFAGVTMGGNDGSLYGTTAGGGLSNANCSGCGTVFKLTPNEASPPVWTETVIHKFAGGTDGSDPMARLLRDSAGVLYGTTYSGGSSKHFGTVFRLTPKTSAQTAFTESILHRFAGGTDGGNPNAGLIFDNSGRLLGTTSREGIKTGQCSQDGRGCGTVFMLTKKATLPWTRTNLHLFKGSNDGMEPSGPLVFTGDNLYGSTRLGGLHGQGSAFKLTALNASHTQWSENLIYSFKAGTDGKGPMGVVASTNIPSPNGHLFGLTEGGGNAGGAVFGGTLFELRPPASGTTWVETVHHRFTGGADGADSQGTLLLWGGVFYGTGNDGGDASSSGTFFKYVP